MKISKEICSVIKALQPLMPSLDKNLAMTYHLYMEGHLAKGAYQYILQRHGNYFALANGFDLDTGEMISETINEKVTEENILGIASWAYSDLCVHIKDDLKVKDGMSDDEKISSKEEQERVTKLHENLLSELQNNGYTTFHSLYKHLPIRESEVTA